MEGLIGLLVGRPPAPLEPIPKLKGLKLAVGFLGLLVTVPGFGFLVTGLMVGFVVGLVGGLLVVKGLSAGGIC